MQDISNTVDSFFSQFPLISLRKGEIVLRPDQHIQDIYLLKSGKVRMYAISSDGEEVTLHMFRPFAYFPLMLVLSNVTNNYYLEAMEPSVAVKAPTAQVIDFIKTNPDVLFDLTTRFADAIGGLLVRIQTVTGEYAYTKVIHLLLYLANRFGHRHGNQIAISIEMSHEDIANWIGLRRETVSRQIEKMQQKQLIHSSNKEVIIHNIDALKQEIEHAS